MTNDDHDTTANQSSGDGQQPHNPNPPPPNTEQVNVGGSVPPVGGELSLTLHTPNRGPSGRETSSTPAKDSPSGRRSPPPPPPPTGRGLSSTKMSPPKGRGSPSSSARGSSSASPNSGGGKISQIGGRNFTPVSADISLRGGSIMTAAGSMIPTATGEYSLQSVKRKADVKAPEGMIPVCSVCKRSDFSSWKALFGHLRSHPERQWRGCFPPPGSQEAQQLALQQQAGDTGAVRGFDLNEVSDLEEDFGEGSGIDLNMPPADDDDDENNDGGGGDGGGSGATETD